MSKWISEQDKARFWIKAKQTDYCWNWEGAVNTRGYGAFNLKDETLAHRIAYQIIYGKIQESLQVLHKCDNPKCINPDHLFTGTHQDNMKDKELKGRSRMLGRASLFYGVSWRNDSKKWRSYVVVNKKMKHLGSHKTEIEAAKHYDFIAYTKYGERLKLNFPSKPLPEPPKDKA